MVFNKLREMILSDTFGTNKTYILEILNGVIFLLLLTVCLLIFNLRTIDQHNLSGHLINESSLISKKDSSLYVAIICPTISQFINIGSVAEITINSNSGFQQNLYGTIINLHKTANSVTLIFKLKASKYNHKSDLFFKKTFFLKNISLRGMSIANFFFKKNNNH